MPPALPFSHIHKDRSKQGTEEKNEGEGIDQGRIPVKAGHQVQKIFDIRIRQVNLTQLMLYGPVPVDAAAVAETVPESQDKP